MTKLFFRFATLLTATALFAACNNTNGNVNGGGNGRMPQNGSGYSEKELDDIMNTNNPLRQGTTYYYSKAFNYSVKYPNSFVNLKKDDKGFSCESKDGVAKLRAWGEMFGGDPKTDVEDVFANVLAEYNKQGAEITDSDLDDDNSFKIEGNIGKRHFYRRTLVYSLALANFEYSYDTSERDDMDPNAVYLWVADELEETLIQGQPPVEPEPAKIDPNAVASVAYVGKWNIFSTMRYEEPYKLYTQFKDVNAWEAQTETGKEVYLILPARESTKVTAKDSKTGERLYSRDGRPLVVRCNPKGEPNMEITFIEETGRITKYVPRHDDKGHPIVSGGISDMTIKPADVKAHPDW
ncbi:MAG: hypothetical protein II752_03120 [Muribaculaceae bacterium]|nr:hypothetical protein [Muribaculaceae bacterium]